MKRKRIVLFILLILVFVLVFFLFSTKILSPRQARILLESTPSATVYINEEQVGKTPMEKVLSPSEIVVKMVPDSFDRPLKTFETKVSLSAGIETVVRRDFGNSEESSSGEVISFEKTEGGETAIAVISTPDAADVSLSNVAQGFTPIKISNIKEGEYELSVSSQGFVKRSFKVRAVYGFRLTAIVKLAKDPSVVLSSESPEEKKEAVKKTEVEILKTPTGFLRVRKEASSSSEEIAKVTPGEKYELLDGKSDTEWFLILLEDGKKGWVSSEYASASAEKKSS